MSAITSFEGSPNVLPMLLDSLVTYVRERPNARVQLRASRIKSDRRE